jgi:hypothetical protein
MRIQDFPPRWDKSAVVYREPKIKKLPWQTLMAMMQHRRRHRLDAVKPAPLPVTPQPLPARVTKTLRPIVRLVEQVFMVPWKRLLGGWRGPTAAQCRLALSSLYWVARKFTKLTSTLIGKAFNRDHSSIIHTSQVVEFSAMMQQQKIPETSPFEALIWIRENIKTLITHKEYNEFRRARLAWRRS